MRRLVLESWLLLLYMDLVMTFQGLETLHNIVRASRTMPISDPSSPSNELLCRSMDYACVFYFRRVLCLQRSAATAIIFRRYGRPALMITGVQILPFRSHAWIEIAGDVVNDRPYMREIYQVLDQC